MRAYCWPRKASMRGARIKRRIRKKEYPNAISFSCHCCTDFDSTNCGGDATVCVFSKLGGRELRDSDRLNVKLWIMLNRGYRSSKIYMDSVLSKNSNSEGIGVRKGIRTETNKIEVQPLVGDQ